jgi:NADPH:quinone reductase-like Zn-dependent oxidoreductase
MKAILRPTYGTADVLQLADIEKPAPAEDQILVKVRAASVNPIDWHLMRGTPYLMRLGFGLPKPRSPRLGADFSGTVESIGNRVSRFKSGDEVFGVGRGSFAEYLTISEDKVAAKPAGLTFEQAAALPIAGLTALQALRDKGQVERGQQVLINGAAGGVGTFAVQIAKSLGAEVAAVCSTPNVEFVRSLGAILVFDYTKDDFAADGRRFDVLLDNVGNRSLADCRRALKSRGIYIGNGGGTPRDNRWGFAMLGSMIHSLVLSSFVSQKLRGILANVNAKDLADLANRVEAGQLMPIIGRRYELSKVPEAIRYLETSHARGKVIIEINQPG